ncbi:general transcriptional corepressor trfA [Culicoides brevitarsis]|uniref:general transcriptional corepressor trfA n=1 Tax=Culicoides brevitarsis TaxID=469753 RepID=UPI00307B4FB2
MLKRLDEIEKYLAYIRQSIEKDKEELGWPHDESKPDIPDDNNNSRAATCLDDNNNNHKAHVLTENLINIGSNCETDGSCSSAAIVATTPRVYTSIRLTRPTEEELNKWDIYRHQEDLPRPWTYFKLNKSVYRPPENIVDDFNNGHIADRQRRESKLFNNSTNDENSRPHMMNKNLNNNSSNILNKNLTDTKTNPWKAREGNEIDQWVTDAFYSYFPSLNETRRDKKLKLARDRQHDYNEYVKQIPEPIPKREQLRQKREQYLSQIKRAELTSASSNDDASSSNGSAGGRPTTPKQRLIQDLQHIGLPAMLQTDVIEQRERKNAEEEAEKRAIYQQELLRQIEEKKRNLEKLRKQQEEEEYRVTRELENQLLTLRLEEELAKQGKKLARTRAVANRDSLRRQTLLSNLMNDKNIAASKDPLDKAMTKNLLDFSENPLNDSNSVRKEDENKIYTYFTNSAKIDKQLSNSSSSSSSTADDLLVLPHINRYQYCKKCRYDIDDSFLNFVASSPSSTSPKDANRIKSCFHCHILDHKLSDKLCQDCHKTFKKLSNGCQKCLNSKEFCEFCQKNDHNFCPFCTDRHEPIKDSNNNKQDLNNNMSPEQIFNNVAIVPMPKRYMDEQNRLPKFINNENETNSKKSAVKPLVSPRTAESKLPRSSFRRLEQKWEVPAVRRFSVHPNAAGVADANNGQIDTFTEVGAFKKQLQTECIKETASE